MRRGAEKFGFSHWLYREILCCCVAAVGVLYQLIFLFELMLTFIFLFLSPFVIGGNVDSDSNADVDVDFDVNVDVDVDVPSSPLFPPHILTQKLKSI